MHALNQSTSPGGARRTRRRILVDGHRGALFARYPGLCLVLRQTGAQVGNARLYELDSVCWSLLVSLVSTVQHDEEEPWLAERGKLKRVGERVSRRGDSLE